MKIPARIAGAGHDAPAQSDRTRAQRRCAPRRTGITLADASQWSDADKELEHALSLPKAWVTDDHYKALAKQTLERVTPHLK